MSNSIATNEFEKISDAIMFDPFEGDFGSQGDRRLKDKIVKFRKQHSCHICNETTSVGEVGRSMTEVFEGEIYSFYFCNKCCAAMVASMDDCDDESITHRYRIGENSRKISGGQ